MLISEIVIVCVEVSDLRFFAETEDRLPVLVSDMLPPADEILGRDD